MYRDNKCKQHPMNKIYMTCIHFSAGYGSIGSSPGTSEICGSNETSDDPSLVEIIHQKEVNSDDWTSQEQIDDSQNVEKCEGNEILNVEAAVGNEEDRKQNGYFSDNEEALLIN